MALNKHGRLAIAQLAFFAPAFLLALALAVRHGFGRSLGWAFLVTLSLLRLIGASTTLYIETQHDYATGIVETAAITSAIGTAPLLLALDGLIERVNGGFASQEKSLPRRPFLIARLLATLGLILAIIGGIYQPTTRAAYRAGNIGTDLNQADSILFLASYLLLAAITIIIFSRRSWCYTGDHALLYVGIAAIPCLLVRVIYSILVAFFVKNDFWYRNVNIYIESFMQFLMEVVVVTMFIVAGLMVGKVKRGAPAV